MLMDNLCWNSFFPLFKLEGKDSKKFLHGQTTADILDAKESSLILACWLSPTGRLKAILEIKIIEGNPYFIVLLGNTNDLIDGFQKVIFPFDDVKIVACNEIRRMQKISVKESWKVNSTRWFFKNEIICDDFRSLQVAEDGLITEWKIRQGLPKDFSEISGKYNPYELGLSDLVNLEKGCYLGQETLSKVKNSGKVKCKLMFFTSNQLIEPGSKLIFDSNSNIDNAGTVTSSLKIGTTTVIGLALIREKYLTYKTIELNESKVTIQLSELISFRGINFD